MLVASGTHRPHMGQPLTTTGSMCEPTGHITVMQTGRGQMVLVVVVALVAVEWVVAVLAVVLSLRGDAVLAVVTDTQRQTGQPRVVPPLVVTVGT